MKIQVPMPSYRRISFHWRMPGVLVLLSLGLVFLASAEISPTVQWKNQRLSVNAEQAPLPQVLREIARQTHIEVEGLGQLQEDRVSAQFVALSLDDAFKRLLVNVNYALVEYATPPKGNPSGIVLVIGRQGGKSSKLATPRGTQLEDERAAREVRLEPEIGRVQLG